MGQGIDALQRELLPPGVPVLPNLQIAASYLLADVDTAAGGDWFDVVTLPDGRIGLIVGDVVGHGLAASAVMGRLQVVLHERLQATGDVLEAIGAADRIAHYVRGAQSATVCVAVLDPDSGALTYCTAGHPPPLLVPADGEPRYLPGSGAGPLGVGSRFATATDRLARGQMLLLYTDGILERPGRELAAATVELARVASDVAANRAMHVSDLPVEGVAVQTLELLTRLTGHSDDITLLAAQLVSTPGDLLVQISDDPAALTVIRRVLGAWMNAIGVAEPDASNLKHAVGELATNAIEHANPDADGTAAVTISGTLTHSGDLKVVVTDQGRWREPSPASDRGFGLAMVAGLIDALDVAHDEHGTVATITHHLTRPARLLTDHTPGTRPAPAYPAEHDLFLILDDPSARRPRIRVDGPIDALTAPSLDKHLRNATVVGTRSLTVDLAGVTHLASAGVAVLHRATAQTIVNETDLRLYAPPGTPADAIMTLVHLAHVTTDPDY
jgi:anti-sigma regulatory factor (Ser/Thr protein kinase)/anti-anti-sigma regulatory factor